MRCRVRRPWRSGKPDTSSAQRKINDRVHYSPPCLLHIRASSRPFRFGPFFSLCFTANHWPRLARAMRCDLKPLSPANEPFLRGQRTSQIMK